MDFQEISLALGIAAGVTQLVGYYVYARLTPHSNIGSWSIWTFSAVLDLAAYAYVTREDLVKDILPVACLIGSISLFGFMVWKGRFGWPDRCDWGFFGLDLVFTVAWYFTNATVATLLYQVSTVLSFVPIARAELKEKDPEMREHPVPWLIWTVAYLLMLASVAMRHPEPAELAYPIVHAGVHLAFMFLILFIWRRNKQTEPAL